LQRGDTKQHFTPEMRRQICFGGFGLSSG